MARDRHFVTLCGIKMIATATICIERRSSGILTWNTQVHNTLIPPLYFPVARTDSTDSNTEISV